MASEKQKLLSWFYRYPFEDGEHSFDEDLVIAAQKVLGKDKIAATEFAYATVGRYWNYLKKEKELDLEKGIRPLFKITDNSSKKLVWYPRKLIGSRRYIREIIRSKARPLLLEEIDNLTDREYEALGCVAANFSGADYISLTPHGDEGGIDFFARITIPSRNHIFGGATPIRVVGQSKKYKNRVSLDKLRDFVTSIQSVKHVSGHVVKHIPRWFRASKGPIIGWIIGHNGFQSGAKTFAHDHGVITSDSLDLAEIIAQSRNYYEELEPDKRASHFKSCVVEILR